MSAHEPMADWTCSCGEDFFGGSAAYSWDLFLGHLPVEDLRALRERVMDDEPAGSASSARQSEVIADLSRRINELASGGAS